MFEVQSIQVLLVLMLDFCKRRACLVIENLFARVILVIAKCRVDEFASGIGFRLTPNIEIGDGTCESDIKRVERIDASFQVFLFIIGSKDRRPDCF